VAVRYPTFAQAMHAAGSIARTDAGPLTSVVIGIDYSSTGFARSPGQRLPGVGAMPRAACRPGGRMWSSRCRTSTDLLSPRYPQRLVNRCSERAGSPPHREPARSVPKMSTPVDGHLLAYGADPEGPSVAALAAGVVAARTAGGDSGARPS